MKTWDLSKNHNSMTTYALNPPEIIQIYKSNTTDNININEVSCKTLEKLLTKFSKGPFGIDYTNLDRF